MPFLLNVWGWIKRNWKWLLFPVGVLLFLTGRMSAAKKQVVIAPELVGASRVSESARSEADKQLSKAAEEKNELLEELRKEYGEDVVKLTEDQKKEVTKLLSDPDALNDYLKTVGKRVRQ